MSAAPPHFAVIDLGNTAAKVAIASSEDVAGSGSPRGTGPPQRLANLGFWNSLALPGEPLTWIVASVQSRRRTSLRQWLARTRPDDRWRELTWRDIPGAHDVAAPERVGMDRWMGFVAARGRWGDGANGVFVLAGTAITVNLIREGAFAGGAILPGFDLALGALHHGTDQLPDLVGRVERLEALPGRDTESAMRSGIGWGTVGAVREIGRRLTENLDRPRWLLSGGNAEMLAEGLDNDAEIVETLTLDGALETFLAGDRESEPVGAFARDADER